MNALARPFRRGFPVGVVVVLVFVAGCAAGRRSGLVVRAGLSSQGILPGVACDIPAVERSRRGLPLLRVAARADCVTEPKVVILAFSAERWIAHATFKRRLPQDNSEPPFAVEMTQVPDRGSEVTVVVWSRCEDGEPEQGVDTCQTP